MEGARKGRGVGRVSSRWMAGKIYRATGRKLAEIGRKEEKKGKKGDGMTILGLELIKIRCWKTECLQETNKKMVTVDVALFRFVSLNSETRCSEHLTFLQE